MSCCLYWIILEERLGLRVLASAVDDWLLCDKATLRNRNYQDLLV